MIILTLSSRYLPRDKVLKNIALPIALAYVVALVCCANDEILIVCLKNRRDIAPDHARDVARAIALVCYTLQDM